MKGLGAMIAEMGGNSSSVEAFSAGVGKTIVALELKDDALHAAAMIPRSPSQSHNALVKQCRDALIAQGIPCRVIRSSSPLRRVTYTGRTPDIIGALPPTGRLLAVECKTGAGRLTEGQREYFDQFEAAGALCVEARSLDDLEVIREAVRSGKALAQYVRAMQKP